MIRDRVMLCLLKIREKLIMIESDLILIEVRDIVKLNEIFRI